MRIKTDIPTYQQLKNCLSELYPDIKVELLDSDPMLQQLGFVDKVPCTIDICVTDEQIKEIMDKAIDFEVSAYNTGEKYPSKNDEAYILYERYGWLFDFFYDAKDDMERIGFDFNNPD